MDTDSSLYYSPTHGSLSLPVVREKILSFIQEGRGIACRLIIGTDSQPKNGEGIDFISVIVVHRVGFGGIYFWRRCVEKKKLVLRNRIYQEATLSLTTAEEFLALFRNDGITRYDLEIHVDIGQGGETREMIAEIVGMVRSSGFIVKTKPDAYGASKVADRHT